jgi:hypothetical protein
MGTAFSGAAFAQDIEINGLFDGYINYSLNRPLNQVVPHRAFDTRHSQFSLNYAEVAVEMKPEPLGFRADIGFGDATNFIHANEPALANGGASLFQYLQQAYIMAKVNDKFQMDFGKFVRPFGAEVIETKDNWNYSRGLLFTYAAPFYHFGLRANYNRSETTQFGFYLVNGWNNVQDNNSAKTMIVSGTFKPKERLTIKASAMLGREQPNAVPIGQVSPFGQGQLQFATAGTPSRRLLDLVLKFDLNENVQLMTNYVYGTESRNDWKGVAAYVRMKLHDRLVIIPRYEWFRDLDGLTAITGSPQTLQEHTLTFLFPVNDDSSIYLDRRDWNKSTDPTTFFAHGSQDILNPGGVVYDMRHFQHTFLIGWTYSFKRD